MARIRKMTIFTMFPFLFGWLAFGRLAGAEVQLPRILYDAKESVVKVEIHLINTHDSERVSDQLKQCFEESDYCVIGTGVRINGNGDVLTAAHVARDTMVVSQTLRDAGIESEVMVAGQARNAEYVKGDASSVTGAFRAAIKAIDPARDVAVMGPDGNAPAQSLSGIDAGSHKVGLRTVKLDTQRPDAGDAIFAFGFATYSPALVTTPGSIILSIGSKVLNEARKSGGNELVPVYHAGLEMSPGNSGGAVFRAGDGALLGIVSEIGNERDTVATVIPAAEVAKFLTANAIKWDAAPPEQAGKRNHKSRHRH